MSVFSNYQSVYFCVSVILEKTIRIPRSLSVKAGSVLKGFLNKVWIVSLLKQEQMYELLLCRLHQGMNAIGFYLLHYFNGI